jgi:hypothetical protein
VESQRAAAAKAAQQQQSEDGQGSGQDAAAAGGLYSLLDERYQSIVAPFLTTKFTQSASKIEGTGESLDGLFCFVTLWHRFHTKFQLLALPAVLVRLVGRNAGKSFAQGPTCQPWDSNSTL